MLTASKPIQMNIKNCIENVHLFPQSAVDYSLLFGVNSRSAIKKFLAAELLIISWQMNIHELEHCQMKLVLVPHCIVGKIFETIKGELLTGLYVTSLKKIPLSFPKLF